MPVGRYRTAMAAFMSNPVKAAPSAVDVVNDSPRRTDVGTGRRGAGGGDATLAG